MISNIYTSQKYLLYLGVVDVGGPVLVCEPVLEGVEGEEAEDLGGEHEVAEDGGGAKHVHHLAVRSQPWVTTVDILYVER